MEILVWFLRLDGRLYLKSYANFISESQLRASLAVELDMRYVAFFIWIDMARAINSSET